MVEILVTAEEAALLLSPERMEVDADPTPVIPNLGPTFVAVTISPRRSPRLTEKRKTVEKAKSASVVSTIPSVQAACYGPPVQVRVLMSGEREVATGLPPWRTGTAVETDHSAPPLLDLTVYTTHPGQRCESPKGRDCRGTVHNTQQ